MLEGVNVAVSVALLPLKELKLPPIDPTSPIAKPVTISFAVKVRDKVASLVMELLATALDPSDAVMVMIGDSESLCDLT